MSATKSRTLLFALAAASFAACSSSHKPAPPTAGENGLDLLEPVASDGMQLRVVEQTSDEHSLCRNFVVPADVDVAGFDHAFVPTATYVAVYRVGDLFNELDADSEGVNTDDSFTCSGVPGPVLYLRATPQGSFRYPETAAVHLPKGTVLRIEAHWFNPMKTQTTNDARVNLVYAKSTPTNKAGGLFFYDFNIVIPPGGTATAKMRCQLPQDIFLSELQPIAHTMITGMRVFVGSPLVPRSAVTSSTAQLIYRSNGFGDLNVVTATVPIHIPAGAVIDFECDYMNRTADVITAGSGALTNESCALAGNYYPRMVPAAENCLLPGSGSAQENGMLTCGQVLDCLQVAGGATPAPGHECALPAGLAGAATLNVCPASQSTLNAVQACVFSACQNCGSASDCDLCQKFFCGSYLTLCTITSCQGG